MKTLEEAALWYALKKYQDSEQINKQTLDDFQAGCEFAYIFYKINIENGKIDLKNKLDMISNMPILLRGGDAFNMKYEVFYEWDDSIENDFFNAWRAINLK